MADRVIRDEILESERWLGLKDNADRLAYFALLLKADCFGNFDAGEYRLLRLWRDYGINTPPLVAKTLTELVEHDLVRLYTVEEKRYLHIPRYRQELRYVSRHFPLSPWTSDKEKQALAKNSRRDPVVSTPCAPPEVKRSEEKRSKTNTSVAASPLPDWLPVKTWTDFEAHRIACKAKLTPKARELALRSLTKLKDTGHDPVAVIERSIERGWRGLFAIKDGEMQKSPEQTRQDKARRAIV